MRSLLSRRPSPAMLVALTALFVALGGVGYAATAVPENSVGTRQLKDGAVTAAKLRDGAVTPSKINLISAVWHEIGRAGQPGFKSGWANAFPPDPTTAAFNRDPLGVVRLKGTIIGGHHGTVFTLPVPFRPRHDVVESINTAGVQGGTVLICGAVVKCGGQPGDVIVSDADGEIPPNVEVSLDGVTFQTDE